MKEFDSLDLEINNSIDSQSPIKAISIMPGFNAVLKINHEVRKLIFDYALIAAILGLFRFARGPLNFLILLLLNLVMAIHIGYYWKTFANRKFTTTIHLIMSFLSSFVIAVLVRGIFSILSLFVPLLAVLNASVGHGILTWLFGRATNHFYLSAKKIDRQTLEEILNNRKIY